MAFGFPRPSSPNSLGNTNDLDTAVRQVQAGLLDHYAGRININYPAPVIPVAPVIEGSDWRRRAIAIRLQVRDGEKFPFDSLETALGTDHVYVMVVANGKGVMLEDERGLFPSDTLVTQLRLISK